MNEKYEMEVVYLDDITGTLGEWISADFVEEVPQKVIELLEEAYNLAVKELCKK